MKNVYLFQPQYSVAHNDEINYWLPYSVGCLWSYVLQFDDIRENFELKDLIFRREPLDQIIGRMEEPALAGFSCYVWNINYCIELAQKIKQRWPNCMIVFGGPQSSGKLIKHNFIDSIVMGEGEEKFLQSLRDILANKPLQQFYQKKRLENLDIPSPYTTGLFDKIISDNPTALWNMTLETNRGCPYSCTFCDWGGVVYSKVKKFELDRVCADMEWAMKNPISYIFCADANFGIYKDRDVEIAKIIRRAVDNSRIDGVNLQFSKNSTETAFSISKIIGTASRGVTISAQSMNDDTLESIKRRNLDVNNIQKMLKLSEKYNVPTYTEMILGLPNETLETWKQGMAELLELGQHNSIDMWFAQLLENSELAQSSSRMQYGIKSVKAKDYLTYVSTNEENKDDIEEQIEIVNQTSTMTTKDMVECYLFGWIIIHFHAAGYTQQYAKYCRNTKNISYRTFYDCMFDALQKENFFKAHFLSLQRIVNNYLHTGELIFEEFNKGLKGGHGLHALGHDFIYNNKSHAFELGRKVAEQFLEIPEHIHKLQENFVYDQNTCYPVIIQTDTTTYEIITKIEKNNDNKFNFYWYRRQGLLKNLVIEKETK